MLNVSFYHFNRCRVCFFLALMIQQLASSYLKESVVSPS
jgi:hypothetical protein